MSLTPDEKEILLSRNRRFLNYLVLKIGLFAIASVWAIADFANRGVGLRIVYGLIIAGLVFYVYFYLDSKKHFKQIEALIRSQ